MNKRINRYSAETSSALPNGLFLVLSAVIAVLLVRDAATLLALSPMADYWTHAAVLREWLQSPASPSNPVVNDPALTPQFVPLYWMLALVGRGLSLDAIQLMTVGAVVNFLLLACGLKLFLSEYFRHAWAPFIGMLVMFFCWGVAGSGSGYFQLSNFLQIAGDPATFAFAISLLAFWVTTRLLRSEVTLPLWAIMLIGLVALAFISHPPTGLFGVIGCMLLAGTEFSASSIPRIAAFGAMIAGLAVAELWPFFSAWQLVLGLYVPAAQVWSPEFMLSGLLDGSAELVRLELLYDPSSLLAALGVTLLGLPLLLRIAQRGEQPFIFYGALLMLVPYLLNALVDMPLLAHTFLLFAVFYLQLAVVWGWLRLISAWSEIPRPVLAAPLLLISMVFGVALIALNFWLVQQAKQGQVFSARTLQLVDVGEPLDGLTVPDLYDELLQPVGDDAVLLAHGMEGGPVPAFGSKLVASATTNPLVADMPERARLTEEFFGKPLTDLERVAVIQRYNVSHVLIKGVATMDSNKTGLQSWLGSYSTVVAERGNFRVHELSDALHQVKLPDPEPDPDEKSAPEARDPDPAPARAPQRASSRPTARAGADDVTAAEQGGNASDTQETDEPEAPRSFGAPIAAPVLDPERHGG